MDIIWLSQRWGKVWPPSVLGILPDLKQWCLSACGDSIFHSTDVVFADCYLPIVERWIGHQIVQWPLIGHQIVQWPLIGHQIVQWPLIGHQIVQWPLIGHQIVQWPLIGLQIVQWPLIGHQIVQWPLIGHQIVQWPLQSCLYINVMDIIWLSQRWGKVWPPSVLGILPDLKQWCLSACGDSIFHSTDVVFADTRIAICPLLSDG